MSVLSSIKPNAKTIPIAPGQEVTLRGLNTTDIMSISVEYGDLINRLFGTVRLDNSTDMAKDLIAAAPELAYVAVAIAADEPEAAGNIKHLPLATQIELISTVYDLTLPNPETDVKKINALLTPVLLSALTNAS